MKHFVQQITHLPMIETGWGNGYAVIPPTHPLYEVHYDKIDVDVHYGLTFSEKITNDMLSIFPALDTEDVGCWMVGFDTAHYGDTQLNWPMERVVEETERLVEQLEKM